MSRAPRADVRGVLPRRGLPRSSGRGIPGRWSRGANFPTGRPVPGSAAGAVLLELAVEGLPVDAEDLGGPRAVAAHGLEDLEDVALLDFLEGYELRAADAPAGAPRRAGASE